MRVTEVVSPHVTSRYFYTDRLGSISVITNEAGAVVERLSYPGARSARCVNVPSFTSGKSPRLSVKTSTSSASISCCARSSLYSPPNKT